MGLGIDLARLDAPEHAQMMEDLRDQLLIAFVARLGGDVVMEADEVDATGQYALAMSLSGRTFRFSLRRKS